MITTSIFILQDPENISNNIIYNFENNSPFSDSEKQQIILYVSDIKNKGLKIKTHFSSTNIIHYKNHLTITIQTKSKDNTGRPISFLCVFQEQHFEQTQNNQLLSLINLFGQQNNIYPFLIADDEILKTIEEIKIHIQNKKKTKLVIGGALILLGIFAIYLIIDNQSNNINKINKKSYNTTDLNFDVGNEVHEQTDSGVDTNKTH